LLNDLFGLTKKPAINIDTVTNALYFNTTLSTAEKCCEPMHIKKMTSTIHNTIGVHVFLWRDSKMNQASEC
jgi:competence transcription factor ComK